MLPFVIPILCKREEFATWRGEGKKPSFLAGFLLLLGNGVLPCSLPDCCVFLIVAVDKEVLVSGHL